MKWIGYRQVKYASISMDVADVRKRSKAAHVAELADDIRKLGDEPIHAVTVRASDKRLLCGRDRMAALLILKAKSVWIHLVDCDEIEAADLEASENVHRRADNRAETLLAAVTAKEALIRAREPRTMSQAPQHSAKAQARKEVARAAGVSTAAVKKAEQRAAAKDVPSDPAGASSPPNDAPAGLPPPPIDLLGTPQLKGNASYDFVRVVQVPLDEADKLLRQAQAVLKRLDGVAGFATVAQQLHAEVHRVASRVRSHRPWAICPWCKCLPALVKTCAGCERRGWVSEEVARRAPTECITSSATMVIGGFVTRQITPPVVMWNGQAVPYDDAAAGKFPKNGRAAPAKGKGISVELPDGSEADLTVDYDEGQA